MTATPHDPRCDRYNALYQEAYPVAARACICGMGNPTDRDSMTDPSREVFTAFIVTGDAVQASVTQATNDAARRSVPSGAAMIRREYHAADGYAALDLARLAVIRLINLTPVAHSIHVLINGERVTV